MSHLKYEDEYFIFDSPKGLGIKGCIKQFIKYNFLTAYYKCLMSLIRPKVLEKKYNIAICAIFKNEAKYLREWIEYHKIVGIEHFYLYNNNSEDDYMGILSPYINEGFVTLVQWPQNHAQMDAYKDCVEKKQK